MEAHVCREFHTIPFLCCNMNPTSKLVMHTITGSNPARRLQHYLYGHWKVSWSITIQLNHNIHQVKIKILASKHGYGQGKHGIMNNPVTSPHISAAKHIYCIHLCCDSFTKENNGSSTNTTWQKLWKTSTMCLPHVATYRHDLDA